ncbi:BUD22-domain-containing protein [Cercophora samala]|uniref:BUD22-domain-containing protein n=1 Tax=Cercophora samala TaxID=330535 RepID=A0AA39ZDF9_9PEZI|nr:BUD22-domain-containing protein [Cercophora samala]
MVKRKRGDDDSSLSVSAVFFKHRDEVFRAIKNAKGRERQRQSKRLKDAKSTPDKKARVQKEIVVLNSLDLHQTAHAHLCSSLLRFKNIAEHEKLPNEIKGGVPKPELTEEERAALHNVTSALYSYAGVKEVVAKALEDVCKALGVPVPEKKAKGKKEKLEDKEEVKEKPEVKKAAEDKTVTKEKAEKKDKKEKDKKEKNEKKDKKEKDTEQKKPKELPVADEDEEEDVDINYGEDVDETVVSRMADLLGSSSEDEEDEEEKLKLAKRQSKTKKPLPKELDPMEITSDEEGGDEADSEDDDDSDDDLDPMQITDDEADEEKDGEASEDEFGGFSDSNQSSASDSDSEEEEEDQQSDASSSALSPPPKKSKRAAKVEVNGSTFLPSLMGGYISGSESASDVDLAPTRKNRRGQRARQAIWEKKFKEQAKHLKKQQEKRDSGWDLKRGAVDGDNKPWKKGIKNPFKATGANDVAVKSEEEPKKDRKRDDLGTLHPSWEARRLAKEKEKLTAPFEGKKITFD